MNQLTLEAIKAEHAKVAEMIAAFEAQAKFESAFPVTVQAPKPNPGELWLGVVITGKKMEHIYLLPGDNDIASWQEQMDWAKSIGGDLPNRVEQAMLYAHMKDKFKEAAYWSNEKHASDSAYAWYQTFSSGRQDYSYTKVKLRARAVRRLEIQ